MNDRTHILGLIITTDGTLRCIYDESLDLASLGEPVIRRASHVEPDAEGKWHADLTPVGGPMLGPFTRRSDALTAERVWLDEHLNHIRSLRETQPAHSDPGPGRAAAAAGHAGCEAGRQRQTQ